MYKRQTDPITLTYAGEKYIEAAKKILTINANLIKEIDEINHEEHGTIKLGIPVQRAMQVMPYVLPRFCLLYTSPGNCLSFPVRVRCQIDFISLLYFFAKLCKNIS